MCTVTFVPTKQGFLLTSSRDEHNARATLTPATYRIGNQKITFPKDTVAGGTWIAADSKKRIACLLNGAFVKHKHQPPYRKSRGQILLESFASLTAEDFMASVALHEIEPFTLVFIDHKNSLEIDELSWDGVQKYHQKIDPTKNHIWSSATLYTPQLQQLRIDWFADWLETYKHVDNKNILAFHNNRHGADAENDVIMTRANGLQTVSITQILANQQPWQMLYVDLMGDTQTITPLAGA